MLGAYVVGVVGLPAKQKAPEPDGEIGHVEPGTERGSVSANVNGCSRNSAAEEISDGKVGVEGEVRADEGERPGDDSLERRAVGVGDTKVLRHALGFVVGGLEQKGIGRGEGGLGDVGLGGGAAAIDGSGGGVEQAVGTGCQRELEDVAGSFQDGLGQGESRLVGLLAPGVGGGMEDVSVRLSREKEVPDVALEQGQDRIKRDVRGFDPKGSSTARKDRGMEIEAELPVGVEERLQDPVAEEASAPGDEDAGSAEFGEEIAGEIEDVVEILRGEGLHGHVSHYAAD